MLGLPMEIVGPVLGVGTVIAFIAASVIAVRFAASRIPLHKAADSDQANRDQLLEDLQMRIGELDHLKQRLSELEERVDFAERLLAQHRDAPRLGGQ
jgi:Leu/Phe-tRNA-protein transferase